MGNHPYHPPATKELYRTKCKCPTTYFCPINLSIVHHTFSRTLRRDGSRNNSRGTNSTRRAHRCLGAPRLPRPETLPQPGKNKHTKHNIAQLHNYYAQKNIIITFTRTQLQWVEDNMLTICPDCRETGWELTEFFGICPQCEQWRVRSLQRTIRTKTQPCQSTHTP